MGTSSSRRETEAEKGTLLRALSGHAAGPAGTQAPDDGFTSE